MKRSWYISFLAAAILTWGALLPAQVSSEQIPFKVGTFEAEGRVFVGAVVGDAKVIDLVKANEALQQRRFGGRYNSPTMNDELSALNVLFTEFYYWVTVVIMFLIHVGFCLYEVGVSREKNKLNTLMKNAMLIPVITVSFFLFGWWIYFAFQNGPGITGGLKSAAWAEPFGELMGPHMGGQPADESLTTGDTATWARLNGVFWAAFYCFPGRPDPFSPARSLNASAPAHFGCWRCWSAALPG